MICLKSAMATVLKAIIVDDEALARRGLKHRLSGLEDIEIVAEARNGREALEMIRKQEPDLVFLDIQMPGMDGFDVLRALDDEDTALEHLFRTVLETVAENIGAWDVGGWSTYDYPYTPGLSRNFNTVTYHLLQALFLQYLGEISGDARLLEVGHRWQASARRLGRRLVALCGKVRYRARTGW